MNAKRSIINFTQEWALLLIVQRRGVSPETINTSKNNNKKKNRRKYTHTYIHTHMYVAIMIKEKEAIGLRGHGGDWRKVPGKGCREKKKNTKTQKVILKMFLIKYSTQKSIPYYTISFLPPFYNFFFCPCPRFWSSFFIRDIYLWYMLIIFSIVLLLCLCCIVNQLLLCIQIYPIFCFIASEFINIMSFPTLRKLSHFFTLLHICCIFHI